MDWTYVGRQQIPGAVSESSDVDVVGDVDHHHVISPSSEMRLPWLDILLVTTLALGKGVMGAPKKIVAPDASCTAYSTVERGQLTVFEVDCSRRVKLRVRGDTIFVDRY
jgi:hypothetical protein